MDQGDTQREERASSCDRDGHLFVKDQYAYAKDESGQPYHGGEGFAGAAKYRYVFCQKCGTTMEINVLPKMKIMD